MRDTLQHLVLETKKRPDSSKFLFILNQLDTSAKEDNPEDIVAAWLRALGEVGMTTGRFYTIFSRSAPQIDEPIRRERFEKKRDADLNEIYERMDQVEIERAYRIVASLRKIANEFHDETIPVLTEALRRWRKRTLVADFFIIASLTFTFLFWSITAGHWEGLSYQPAWLTWIEDHGIKYGLEGIEATLILVLIIAHLWVRKLAAATVMPWLRKQVAEKTPPGNLIEAFRYHTQRWSAVLTGVPSGWNTWSKGLVDKVMHDCEFYVQSLNERFTNPKGLKD